MTRESLAKALASVVGETLKKHGCALAAFQIIARLKDGSVAVFREGRDAFAVIPNPAQPGPGQNAPQQTDLFMQDQPCAKPLSYVQKRYRHLKKKGICVTCARRPASPGLVRCELCRNKTPRRIGAGIVEADNA